MTVMSDFDDIEAWNALEEQVARAMNERNNLRAELTSANKRIAELEAFVVIVGTAIEDGEIGDNGSVPEALAALGGEE